MQAPTSSDKSYDCLFYSHLPDPHHNPTGSIAEARARGYTILSSDEEETDYLLMNPLAAHNDPFNRDNPNVRDWMRRSWFYPRTRFVNARNQRLETVWWGGPLEWRRRMWYMTAGIPRGKWETVYEGPNRKRLMEDGRRWLEAVGPREMGLRVVLAGWREEDVPTDVDRVGGEEGMLERSYDDSLTEWTRPRASLRRSEHVWLKDQTLNKAGVPDYLDILNEARSSKTSRRISAAWRRLHG